MESIKRHIKSTLFVEGFGSLIINIVNKLLLLYISILLFRTLGSAQYGIYSYVQSIIFILIIPAEFGIFNLVIREVSYAVSQENHSLVKGIYRWASKTGGVISLSIVVISLITVSIFRENFSDLERLTFFWGVSLVPIITLEHINSAALQGFKKIILGQLPKIILFPLFHILFILVFSKLTPNLLTAKSVMAFKSLSMLLSLLIAMYIYFFNLPKSIRESSPIYKQNAWIRSILPLGLSSGLNIIKSRTSIILLGFFTNASDIGVFQVAISTAEITAMVLYITNLVLAPQFASLFIQGKLDKLQRLVTISARIIFLYNIIITILIILFGRTILTVLYGDEIINAYPILIILILGQMVNSLAGSVAYLLNMTGHENEVLRAIGISSIFSIIANLIFINLWGIIGAALANSLSLMIAQFLMLIKVKKRIGINSTAFSKLT